MKGRISQRKAYEIAVSVVNEKYNSRIRHETANAIRVTGKILKGNIPKLILDAYELHPEYFSKPSIYFRHDGVRLGTGYLNIPHYTHHFVSEDYLSKNFTEIEINTIVNHWKKVNDLEASKKQTRKELEKSILAFGTYAQLRKGFPEIVKYLPKEEKKLKSTLPAVNIDALRKFVQS